MEWSEFLGHHRQRRWFQNAIEHHRLASTFLLVGPNGIGKKTFAKLVSKSLLCTNTPEDQLSFCNTCETCVQLEAGTHPDLKVVEREEKKTLVTMEQIVGEQSGLCYELRMRPYSGRRKIAIINDIDTFEAEQANSLLKTLEEPPPGAIIFLVGTSEHLQLSTIRSRSQIVRFSPLTSTELAELLLRNKLAETTQEAQSIAQVARGSLEIAAQLKNPTLREFRTHLLTCLLQRPLDFVRLNKLILDHLKDEVPDGQPRREFLRWIFDEAIDSLRTALRVCLGAEARQHKHLDPFESLPPTTLTKLIHLTMKTRGDVSRNIAPAVLVETWTAELTSIAKA